MRNSKNLERESYDWFLWCSIKCDTHSFHWKSFATALLKRFHDKENDDPCNKFMYLKQKGNINDYTHEWEVLAIRKNKFTYEKLLKMYICGVKDYICSEIKP